MLAAQRRDGVHDAGKNRERHERHVARMLAGSGGTVQQGSDPGDVLHLAHPSARAMLELDRSGRFTP
ncbi:MAG: hypothetical protein WDN25_15765 [Acetobacteraceae bacterium]